MQNKRSENILECYAKDGPDSVLDLLQSQSDDVNLMKFFYNKLVNDWGCLESLGPLFRQQQLYENLEITKDNVAVLIEKLTILQIYIYHTE